MSAQPIAESRKSDAAAGVAEQTYRVPRAQKAYDGRLDEPMQVDPGEPNLNVNVNLCKLVVNERTEALFGDELQFTLTNDAASAPDQPGGPSRDQNGELGEPATAGAGASGGEGASADDGKDPVERSPVELWLDSMWRANRQMITLTKWRQNGGIAGHGYLKLQTNLAEQTRTPQSVRLLVLDSACMEVIYADDDIDYVLEYRQTWNATDPKNGEPIVRRQRTVRGTYVQKVNMFGRPSGGPALTMTDDAGATLPAQWSIIDEVSAADANVWTAIAPPAVWPFAWPPIIDCQNRIRANEYLGGPDLDDDLVDLQENLNMSMSIGQRAAHNHGHPIPYATGVEAGQLATVTLRGGRFLPVPNEDAKVGMLEISGTGLDAVLSMVEQVKAVFHEVGSYPDLSHASLTGIGDLSGLALKILMRPLVQVVHELRLTYGTAIDTLHARLLEYAGLGVGWETTVQWSSAIPVDEIETLTVADGKIKVGVSKDTVLRELGYNPEEEAEKRQGEEDAANAALADAFAKGNLADQGGTPGGTAAPVPPGAPAPGKPAGAAGAA